MIIRTGQIGKAQGVDTTVKSATAEGACLKPTWEIVMGHKRGEITDQQYTDAYLAMLRVRYKANPEPFLNLIQRGEVTLLCYCKAGKFCHRHIAAGVLQKIGAAHGIEVVIEAE